MLNEIIEKRMRSLAMKMATVKLRDVKARAADLPPVRDFRGALAGARGLGLIAEIKRASPAKGPLAPRLDPAERAAAYERGGADCLSVLTEPDFFQGSLDDLVTARAACRLPVLRKDFILAPYQVYESRAAGADCMLLIVAALGRERLKELAGIAKEIGLQVLVEAHDEEELDAAAGADVIGVNNRNLATLEVSLDTMARLIPLAAPGSVTVAESGIMLRADAEAARAAGARGLLVGERLVKEADPGPWIQELKLL